MILAEDEIILQIRKENQEARELLFSLYEINFRNVEKKVQYFLQFLGIGREDLRSILWQETLKIIEEYEMDKSLFFSFWKLLIERTIFNEIRRKEKRIEMHKNMFSLDENYVENKLQITENTVERQIHDDYQLYLLNLKINFSNLDREIVKLWSQGYTYQEISEIVNLSAPQVGYIIHRSIKFLKDKRQDN